ncbi:hypothetical protein N7488_000130 [Penicillium malachiteum]|nr:hypothetical protein N7488_000130 [Penicillium malachiteum]
MIGRLGRPSSYTKRFSYAPILSEELNNTPEDDQDMSLGAEKELIDGMTNAAEDIELNEKAKASEGSESEVYESDI